MFVSSESSWKFKLSFSGAHRRFEICVFLREKKYIYDEKDKLTGLGLAWKCKEFNIVLLVRAPYCLALLIFYHFLAGAILSIYEKSISIGDSFSTMAPRKYKYLTKWVLRRPYPRCWISRCERLHSWLWIFATLLTEIQFWPIFMWRF